jgi:hypothetical protein
MNKEVEQLLRLALSQGFILKKGGRKQGVSNHYKLISPTGNLVIMPKTPSDPRAIKNIESILRRYGLQRRP